MKWDRQHIDLKLHLFKTSTCGNAKKQMMSRLKNLPLTSYCVSDKVSLVSKRKNKATIRTCRTFGFHKAIRCKPK